MIDGDPNSSSPPDIEIGPADEEKPIIIGDNHVNRVEIPIASGPTDERSLQIIVRVRFGMDEPALLRGAGDPLKVTASFHGKETELQRVGEKADEKFLEWSTASRPALAPKISENSGVTVTLDQFRTVTGPGTAQVNVAVRVYDEAGHRWLPQDPAEARGKDVEIKKVAPAGEEPEIDYFRVEPDFVLRAGNEVTASFHGRNFACYTLFRNNQKVKSWESDGEHSDTHEPSLTTAYRLEAKPEGPDATVKKLYRTVQMVSPGWNQLTMPQGHPTQLFVHKDFGGNSGLRLYGIFRNNSDGSAALYSAVTGIDDWVLEGDIPDEMAHMIDSPGVAFDDKLWLIGGSSFDEEKPSKQVWCYSKSTDPQVTTRAWRKQEGEDLPSVLACHSCFVVQHPSPQIWVVGGIGKTEHSSEVIVKEVGSSWRIDEQKALPGGGRRHVAATATHDERLNMSVPCLYGGISLDKGKDVIRTDMLAWSRDRHGAGQDQTALKWQNQDGLHPHQGYPLAATLVAIPSAEELTFNAGAFPQQKQRLFLAGTFILPEDNEPEPTCPLTRPSEGPSLNITTSRLYEWMPDGRRWEARGVDQGWESFGGAWFRMQAISFNGFLFVWSLGQLPQAGTEPKLNILIPR